MKILEFDQINKFQTDYTTKTNPVLKNPMTLLGIKIQFKLLKIRLIVVADLSQSDGHKTVK